MKVSFILAGLALVLASCMPKAEVTATPGTMNAPDTTIRPDPIRLVRVLPSSSPSYNSHFVFEVYDLSVNATDIALFADANCTEEIPTSFYQYTRSGPDAYFFGDISEPGSYTFAAKQYDGVFNQWSNCSTQNISLMIFTPSPASSFAMSPLYSNPSAVAKPSIRASGVVKDHTVKLFSDSNCVTEIASGVASATYIDLIPTQDLPVGTSNIYSRSLNEGDYPSACSTVNLVYVRN